MLLVSQPAHDSHSSYIRGLKFFTIRGLSGELCFVLMVDIFIIPCQWGRVACNVIIFKVEQNTPKCHKTNKAKEGQLKTTIHTCNLCKQNLIPAYDYNLVDAVARVRNCFKMGVSKQDDHKTIHNDLHTLYTFNKLVHLTLKYLLPIGNAQTVL